MQPPAHGGDMAEAEVDWAESSMDTQSDNEGDPNLGRNQSDNEGHPTLGRNYRGDESVSVAIPAQCFVRGREARAGGASQPCAPTWASHLPWRAATAEWGATAAPPAPLPGAPLNFLLLETHALTVQDDDPAQVLKPRMRLNNQSELKMRPFIDHLYLH